MPEHRRDRSSWSVALFAHVVLILILGAVVREGPIWDELLQWEESGEPGGGGGGRSYSIVVLPPAAPKEQPRVVVPPVRQPPVPVVAPPVIPPVATTPPAPPADSVPRPAGDSGSRAGSGGGTGGGSGSGTGPGTGPGSGPGRGPGTGGGGSGTSLARAPEPRQLILPPFDFPKEMRGTTIQVTFVVESDGKVATVVFSPEVPDRAYAKKLENVMKSYRFRPARSPEGLPVRGATTVHITF